VKKEENGKELPLSVGFNYDDDGNFHGLSEIYDFRR
jgi:hypothetical protein